MAGYSFEVNQIGSVSSQREPTSPLSSPTSMPFPYRASAHRVIKSQTGDSHSRLSRSFNSYALRSPQSSHLTSYFDDRPVHTVPLKALLTTNNLVIAWSTEQLREFLEFQEYDIQKCTKSLFDIVSPDDRDRLYRLSSQIETEVQRKDATYCPPPPATVYAAIQNTTTAEVAHACAHSRVLQETLDLRLPCGQKNRTVRTVIRMQVVRTSVFFVVAELASVTELPALASFKASSPTQYSALPAYDAQIPMQPMSSPLQPSYPADSPLYAYHQPRGTLSPGGSRPRSVHSESTYPSLAPYANSSSSNSSGQNWARNPLPPNLLQGPNFRRHSDQPLAPNSLTLPPLRSSFRSLDRPNSAEACIKTESVRGEQVPLPRRIAVQDVLQ